MNRIAWICDCHNDYKLTSVGSATVDGLSTFLAPPVIKIIKGKSMYLYLPTNCSL